MSQQLNSKYYEKDDIILVQTLGTVAKDIAADTWVLNYATSYKVEKVELLNSVNWRYKVTFKSDHIFKIGDRVTVTGSNGLKTSGKVYSVVGKRIVTFGDQGDLSGSTVESLTVRRVISKADFKNYSVDNLATDVQNVYKRQADTLVATSSLPSYNSATLQTKESTIKFSGTFPPVGSGTTDTFKIVSTGDHGFYTGDAVYYKPQTVTTTSTDIDGNTITTSTVQTGIAEEGLYFVKRLQDSTSIKLSRSRSELNDNTFITTQAITVTDNTISLYDFEGKTLDNQKLFREIPEQNNDLNSVETLPGTKNGILVNGVEILNYKSTDFLHYNRIEEIVVDKSGEDYDVINPPNFVITDTAGIGATANVAVTGSFSRIDLISGGFDYTDIPEVTITGGNGKNATASVNTQLIDHKVDFNSGANFQLVDLSNNTIAFSTYHKFRDSDKVIYQTNEGSGISGLTTGASYYVSIENSHKVKLHNTYQDSVDGVSAVNLQSYGIGRHTLMAETQKRIVSSINVVDPGEGYQNNKTTVSGVSTARNEITITDHRYVSGEKIVYTTSSTAIGGLTSDTEYYVKVIDKDTIQLSEISSSDDPEKLYRNGEYVNLTTKQTGIHHFNYSDISVTLSGKIGVGGTLSADLFRASFHPIVRGEITSVNLQDKGVGYGSSEVLNHQREPLITLQTGSDAQLQPVVSATGQIVQIIVQNGGKDINAVPKLNVVSDSGSGAFIVPIISGGQITEVEIISKGSNYLPEDTSIEVVYPGTGAEFHTELQTWNVNNFQKNLNKVLPDDGFLDSEPGSTTIQYTSLYAPRLLRQKLYTKTQDGKIQFNNPDLVLDAGAEKLTSKDHSAIIGWAYDGNPIYGPFGYSKKSGGVVTQLKSGYRLSLADNRPPISSFPAGFFVEDYTYIASSDETVLDENNGRFCVTPDFPKGTYAYFTTLSETPNSQGPFANYKEPQFPYLIGKSLHSKPCGFNYTTSSNQDDYDIQANGWIRNSKYYNLDDEVASYDYVERPYKLDNQQVSKVTYASPGGIDYVGIQSGGTNYKVNDTLIIDSAETSGGGADIRVSKVGGKVVSQVSASTTSINSVEVIPVGKSGQYELYASSPHGYKNAELIVLSGVSTTQVNLAGQYLAGISTITIALKSGIGTVGATGIVTYFPVYASKLDAISENDIFKFDDEKVKILNVDRESNRIRVQREVFGTTGAAHTASTVGYEDSRRFTAPIGFKTNFDFQRNRELYFDPQNTVAIGTAVGVGTTIVFVNPGSGATNVFAPAKSLYIPGHGLNTGDELIYNLNGGSGIVYNEPNNVGVASTFIDGQRVFVAKLSDDFIGIGTVKVGLGSTGTFVGVGTTTATQSTVFFTGIGTGLNHSFTTNYENVVTVTSSKNVVTVATATTHGLLPTDNVFVDVKPTTTVTNAVSYNDFNRRIVINKKDVLAAGISTITNEVTISDHGYTEGQALIYTASSAAGGLTNETIYYAVVIDKDTIKLASSYLNATENIPTVINITSATDSSFSPVNPPLKLYENQTVEFDLSDSSLSYTLNSINYPAFKFEIFIDEACITEFNKLADLKSFSVSQTGTVGVDGKTTLSVFDGTPKNLYYKLTPIDKDRLPEVKSGVIIDESVVNNNQLIILNSAYSGNYKASVTSPTEFQYFVPTVPEKLSYTSTDANINYSTNSLTGIGSIAELRTFNSGANYFKLPVVRGVNTGIGSGAAFEIFSDTIGVVRNTRLRSIGFDYPYDKTLRPSAKLPEILKIDNMAILDTVGITSYGYGYGSVAPKILMFDGQTGEQKTEVDLEFKFGTNELRIVRNTFGIYPVEPRLLPTLNTNGVGISTLSYNSSSKEVYVTLNTGFSTVGSFPFAVGDEVLVENVSVGIASTNAQGVLEFVPSGTGYNSKDYDYKLFTLTAVDANVGGIGTLAFSLDGLINAGESPGTVNLQKSSGRIIPKKHFPVFDVALTSSDFIDGEDIICLDDSEMTGIVETWDGNNGYLKVRSNSEFDDGHVLEGKSSGSRGIVSSAIRFKSSYDIDATSRFENGWEDVSGFLNDTRQVIQDSDYYQKFSYALKSRIDMEDWDELVGSLNHTSGFKRFSNLVVETTDDIGGAVVGLGTTTYFDLLIDFVGDVDLNCVDNFDIVKENYKEGFSDKIIFGNQILTDYEESIGNRVLNVDNVADQFNSNPRIDKFADVATFSLGDATAVKFLTYIQDTDYTGEASIGMVSVLVDRSGVGYLNQYAETETVFPLGSFDFSADGTTGKLQFYPTKADDNSYRVFTLEYGLSDLNVATGSTHYGGQVSIETQSENVSVGTTTTIVSVGTTYQAAKVLVQIALADGNREFEELSVIHDGTTADLVEYGQLCSSGGGGAYSGTSGFGTYHPYIDGSTLKVDFIPNVSVAATVNTIAVAISSEGTGIGSFGLKNAIIGAISGASIASSGSPTATTVDEYRNDSFNGAYYIVEVSDPDNNQHQLSEILVIDKGPDFTDTFINEFGVLTSDLTPYTGLGTFGATVSGDAVALTFTPTANKNVEVRGFFNHIRNSDSNDPDTDISFTNAFIHSEIANYTGANQDIKRAFGMTYNGNNIFERYIDAEDTSVIGLSPSALVEDAFVIPNHFFVTGEKLSYSTLGAGTSENIGITTVNIPGIGNTDKLPDTVYAIKLDANSIRLASSAENALKTIPEYFEIASVGIGNSHRFTATNQNSKCLIAIDNYIQSPIVSTATTMATANQTFASSDEIYIKSGISSITGGELLQIEDEIVKVRSVGIGSTNIVRVNRAWLGTVRAGYATDTIITKVQGNYNIVNNTLNFVEAPYGNIPIGSTTNPPDERDWTGITTSSTFQARVFLKSGTPGSSNDAYYNNYIFDDASSTFTGTNETFSLNVDGAGVTGFENDNAILLINDIIQVPGISENFTLAEQSGITSAIFVSDGQVPTYDINSVNLPIGGVIVSVGSSSGFGYQPRLGAGATVTVSAAGTISAVSLGNTGSGYRAAEIYDIETHTTTAIGVGSTIMTLNDENSLFKILEFNVGSAKSIGVGTFFSRPTPIISVGATSVNIGIGSTASLEIPANTPVTVRVFSPEIGVARVGVASSSVGITTVTHIGIVSISAGHVLSPVHITSVGSGYTSSNLPEVVVEEPLPYDNIPLIYQTDGLAVASTGVGTQAKVNLTVGFGSDVVDFSIENTGFGYAVDQTLTIPTGGPTGIPTDPTLGGSFERFSINVEEIFTDKFASWSIGQIQTLDDISDKFDGVTKDFQLRIAGNITSIIAGKGSPVNVQDVLIVLYNNILQVPGEGYLFEGGSTIVFPEPPKPGDLCSILFYRGNGSVDVQSIDILETVKEGDTLQIKNDPSLGQLRSLEEDKRLVYSVDSTDQVTTNAYYGPGNTQDVNLERPVTWCRQTEDKIINGVRVAKDRIQYKANIFPSSNVLTTVGVGSTVIYLEDVRPIFNQQNENDISIAFQKNIEIVSQDRKIGAAATAIVGTAGTITSISISDGGVGYTTAPSVTIANPVGLGSTQRQTATATITNGVVTAVNLGTAKTGYASTTPPVVLIEPPTATTEKITSSAIEFEGDSGIIVAVDETTVGVNTGLKLSFFIPNESPFRNSTLVGTAITVSQIQAGDYFVVRNSSVGFGVTSLDDSLATVGVGTTCIDNVYKVISTSEAQKTLPGYGSTTVLDVTVSVLSYNGYDYGNIGVNTYFGNYSYGKITVDARTATSAFNAYTENGVNGISTGAYVRRTLPLKIENYNV